MADFNQQFNYDDVFLRDITIGLISQFHKKLRWTTKFDSVDKLVTIPFYYGMKGDNRLNFDAFIDQVTGERPELNIDPVPRAHVTLSTWSIKTNEYTNPNVRLQTYIEKDGLLQKSSAIYRPIPLKLSFEVTIIVDTEVDMFKFSQSMWDLFAFYKYFYVEYKYIRIDSVMEIPDSLNTEFPREMAAMSGEDKRSIKLSIDVHTIYPIPPIESAIIPTNKKVIFKGSLNEIKNINRSRTWLGGDINS